MMPSLFIGDPYAALGVRPFVNAAGTRTMHGGAPVSADVRAVMDRALAKFADLDEVMAAASRRLAAHTGAEAGIVTPGAAAAIVQATAACITGRDPLNILRLPQLARERVVLMPRGQRFAYDAAVRLTGVSVREVDNITDPACLSPDVAMILLLGSRVEDGSFLQQLSIAARAAGVPIVVDAAAEPLAQPERWLARGADLAIYSGGKLLCGPQSAGLLLGRADLVEAAWRHGAPHLGVLRALKVSREAIVGVLAAVERWVERDAAADIARWHAMLDTLAGRLGSDRFTCTRIAPMPGSPVPRLRIGWDAAAGWTGPQVLERLDAVEPRIVLRELGARGHHVEIDPFCLTEHDLPVIAEALIATMDSDPPPPPPAPPSCVGEWRFRIGDRSGTMTIGDDGRGEFRSADATGDIRVLRTGELLLAVDIEGTTATWRVMPREGDNGLVGEARLGTGQRDDDGPDRSADQFGCVAFNAERLESYV